MDTVGCAVKFLCSIFGLVGQCPAVSPNQALHFCSKGTHTSRLEALFFFLFFLKKYLKDGLRLPESQVHLCAILLFGVYLALCVVIEAENGDEE